MPGARSSRTGCQPAVATRGDRHGVGLAGEQACDSHLPVAFPSPDGDRAIRDDDGRHLGLDAPVRRGSVPVDGQPAQRREVNRGVDDRDGDIGLDHGPHGGHGRNRAKVAKVGCESWFV